MPYRFSGQGLPVENGKSGQHDWILNILISLINKF